MNREEFFKRYAFDRSADRLGSGNFGTVFRAYDTVQDCWVALKISAVEAGVARLSQEVELVKSLGSHVNVAGYTGCYTFDTDTGVVDVAVLQYYGEGSLADLISRGLPGPHVADDLLLQLLDGLEFLHDRHVTHRDLKPGNILIARRPDGRLVPKIADFGVSKQSRDDVDDTVTPAATVGYAAPEQLLGKPVGAKADLWSFGVIAYHLLTGRLPFDPDNCDRSSLAGRAEVVTKITSGIVPADIAALPRPWNIVVEACLKVDPSQRVSDEGQIRRLICDHSPEHDETKCQSVDGGVKARQAVHPAPSGESAHSEESRPISWKYPVIVLIVLIPVLVALIRKLSEPDKTPIAPVVESVEPIEQAVWTEPVVVEEVAEPVDTTVTESVVVPDETPSAVVIDYEPVDSSGYALPDTTYYFD